MILRTPPKKMVTRPDRLYKTPPTSRGTSPSRDSNTSRGNSPSRVKNSLSNNNFTPLPSPKKAAKSPLKRSSSIRGGRSPVRSIGNSPVKSIGDSPVKIRENIPGSRGSEAGSIERLDCDNNLHRIITSYNQTEDNINVVVRVRPLNPKEIKSGDISVVQFPGNGQVMVDAIPGGPSGGQKPKLFSYNVVFEPAATQDDVLQFSGMKRLIEMAVEGFRCTCFCYGQTGSGKTHTLTGPPGLFGIKTAPYSDKHGLIFRSFLYLFQLIQGKPDVHFVLKASFLEIYNEKVIDLLNPGSARKPLAVRWNKKARGFYVENLFTVDCEELDDLIAVLEEGLRNRSVGRHNMNDYSSRSHTILTVYITSETPAEDGVFLSRSGKINFVDLAGSEMTKKTQSEGKTLEEANNINKSLMVLGYCISSLSDSKRKGNHIPYRDSKLTKLLADSLAGNGVTLMIACISPAKYNISETINTLRYAARAKRIRTKPVVLMDPREALILSLKREVGVLQEENEHLRLALNVYSNTNPTEVFIGTDTKRIPETPLHVDLDELANLDGPQLAELIRLYIKENGELRKENIELFSSREILQRDHEIVCRENERLLKKLEEVNSSPLIPARPAFSADALINSDEVDLNDDTSTGTHIWTTPPDKEKLQDSQQVIPEFIRKELNKRQIGNGTRTPRLSNHRPSSWEDKPNAPKVVRIKSSNSVDITYRNTRKTNEEKGLTSNLPEINNRRFSIARQKSEANEKEVFGSVISLTDEEEIN